MTKIVFFLSAFLSKPFNYYLHGCCVFDCSDPAKSYKFYQWAIRLLIQFNWEYLIYSIGQIH